MAAIGGAQSTDDQRLSGGDINMDDAGARKRGASPSAHGAPRKRHCDHFDGAAPGLWRAAPVVGTLCHTYDCEKCDDFGDHAHESVAAGELAQMVDAAAKAHRRAHHEDLMPRYTISQWTAALPPVQLQASTPRRPVLSPACVLAMYITALPADLLLSEVAMRRENRPCVAPEDVQEARSYREHAAALLSVLWDVSRRADRATHDAWFDAFSAETPDVVMGLFPKRFFWTGNGDSADRLYPVVRVLDMPWGDRIECVLPSRPFGLFEARRFTAGSGVLIMGPGGHPHLPFSAWLGVSGFTGATRTTSHGTYHVPLSGDRNARATLLAEALAIPWVSRSESQRECVRTHGALFRAEYGEDAWIKFQDDVGAVDMLEQELAVASDSLDVVPRAIRLIVQENTAHWNEVQLQAYAFMRYVFESRTEAAILALQKARTVAPLKYIPFRALDYSPMESITPETVVTHLVEVCGTSADDMRDLRNLARDWTLPDVVGRNLLERQSWRTVLHAHRQDTSIPSGLTTRADDPSLDNVDAKWAIKTFSAQTRSSVHQRESVAPQTRGRGVSRGSSFGRDDALSVTSSRR